MNVKELVYRLITLGSKRNRFQAASALLRLSFLEFFFGKKRDIRFSCFGFTMHASNYAALRFLLTEMFIEEQYFFRTNEKTPLIVDCGSNIGISVLYFKFIYPEATILCFEPQRKAFELLEKNIKTNNLKSVSAYNVALSHEDGEVDFYEPETGVGLMASMDNSRETHGTLIRVPTSKLSSFLEGKSPALIKIDVEGAEDMVVHDIFSHHHNPPQLLLEYHHGITGRKDSLGNFLQAFEEKNYSYRIHSKSVAIDEYQDIRIHFVKKS